MRCGTGSRRSNLELIMQAGTLSNSKFLKVKLEINQIWFDFIGSKSMDNIVHWLQYYKQTFHCYILFPGLACDSSPFLSGWNYGRWNWSFARKVLGSITLDPCFWLHGFSSLIKVERPKLDANWNGIGEYKCLRVQCVSTRWRKLLLGAVCRM